MKGLLAALILLSSCELVDEAAKQPGKLRRGAAVSTEREEKILRAFFSVDYAEKKASHLAQYDLADFDSVSQPRPRVEDVIAQYGMADATWEADLSTYGVASRALVYRYGRLGLATPTSRNDGEIFWTLIVAAPAGSTSAR